MRLIVKNKVLIIVLASLIILSIPHILRYVYQDNLLIGEDSYYNLRLANFIKEAGSIPAYDGFSYGGRPIVEELGWIVLLSVNPEVMSRVLPFLLGILSAILFYLIAERINPKLGFISTILFVISPGFIYLFSVSTKYAGAIFLGLLGFYFILRKNYLIGSVFLSLISFFSIWGAVVSLFLFFILSLWKKYNKNWFLISVILSLIFIIVQYLRLLSLRFPEFVFFYLREEGINYFFQRLISDFGGLYGVGFVGLVLVLIGVYNLWRYKYGYLFVYLAIFVLLLLNTYLVFISFYLNVFIALLGGYGFMNILKSRWESSLVKNVCIFLIICGLMFSSVSYIDRLGSLQPRKEVYDAIYYLDRKAGEDVVFSYYKRGLWINYGEKKNMIDSKLFYAPDVRERFNDHNKLLYTQDTDVAVEIINKYNIKFIWVDKWMKEDLWDGEEELLYLLKYSKRFKKVFDNDHVEIWRFKG